jgi:MurNAc alpha-1-phosphate uridylyltransferase
MIDTIMLFAAGLGTRMRHLPDNNPKSLLHILDKPILHHALDLCKSYPFKQIIVNTHYLHHMIEESIEEYRNLNPNFPPIITIYEDELLETGGAIKNAIKLIGNDPIFTLNTDTVIQSDRNLFKFLISEWENREKDKTKIDFMLLMQPINQTIGSTRHGDFDLNSNGKLIRPDKQGDYSYMYAGLQILRPEKICKNPLKIFSLREYYLNSDKVYAAVAKDTKWYHASSPEDIVEIEMNMLAHSG